MRHLLFAALLALTGTAAIVWMLLQPAASPPVEQFDVAQALGGTPAEGFARATEPRAFRFPDDHGPHPDYRNEWWYFTGNLATEAGRRFGYELSIFRIALSPSATVRSSAWGTNQVYMAHFALTDVASGKFHFFERFARGAARLAGAQAEPFAVWLEDWRIESDAHDAQTWRLHAAAGDVSIELALTPRKPVVLQGERGLSRKSADAGNASYYYSLPRLASIGTITVAGEQHGIAGDSWLDREWSTSALGPDQVGWDWFALQLSDGSDLMIYQLRNADGQADRFSAGVLVARDGRTVALTRADFRIDVLDRWRSPRDDAQGRGSPTRGGENRTPGPPRRPPGMAGGSATPGAVVESALGLRGGEYPARWRLSVPKAQLVLEVVPVLADQELSVSIRYWEGAVDVGGTRADKAVTGRGYVELTGYAQTASRNERNLPWR